MHSREPSQFLIRQGIILYLLFPALVHASMQLLVEGIEIPLKDAVIARVSLSTYGKRTISDAQAQRLIRQAPRQASEALQPYGYYASQINASVKHSGKDWQVTLHVNPGEPVRVTAVDITLTGSARAVRSIGRAVHRLIKIKGTQLNNARYEARRDALSEALTTHGFLDAKLVQHRITVRLAHHNAVISLTWKPGPRYRYGVVHFIGSPFYPGFLQRYVPFRSGDYFSQNQLLTLQKALNNTGYFTVVNILPTRDKAKPGIVNIKVQLVPAKRTIYSGGIFFGTDTGLGLHGSMKHRWINRHGHSWENNIVLAQRLKTLSTLYAIPLAGVHGRRFNLGANYSDAHTKTSQSRTIKLVAKQLGQWHDWTRTLGVKVLIGTFTVGRRGNEPDNTPGIEHGLSNLLFAEIGLARKQAHNLHFVRHGWALDFHLRSTAGTLLSSTRFSQITAAARWIHAFGRRTRLILHSTLGALWTSHFERLPPELRFFAGGDHSVRGYDFQSIGPKNRYGRVIGGRHLLIAGATVEHYFTRRWGIDTFIDIGNAFNRYVHRPKLGSGLGLRWRSPVGLIGLDLGVPVKDRDHHGIRLHISIGTDL